MAYDNSYAAEGTYQRPELVYFAQLSPVSKQSYLSLKTSIGEEPFMGKCASSHIYYLRKFVELWNLDTSTSSLASLQKAYANESYLHAWYKRSHGLGAPPHLSRVKRREVKQGLDQLGGEVEESEVNSGEKKSDELSLDDLKGNQNLLAKLAEAASEVIGNHLTTLTNTLEAKIQQLAPTKTDLEEIITKIAREELLKQLPREILITNTTTKLSQNLSYQHKNFELLLKLCQVKNLDGFAPNIWITGPTGSGKTTAAHNVAKALSLPFAADSSLDADYKVTGFRNAQGEIVSTLFRDIFTNGGIYVADEADNWSPSAWIALNAPLANNWCAFPDKIIPRHPNCIIIACANTWGMGATNDYVGRNKLDAATLNRFLPKIDWPYDESLETNLATSHGGELGNNFATFIQNCRKQAKAKGLKIIISPRDTYVGTALLTQGFTQKEVVAMTFGAGLTTEQINQITT